MTNNKFLSVEIVTAQSVVYKGEASSVSVQGSQSPFTILVNHSPIVSSLDDGILKIKDVNDKKLAFITSSGFVEVNKNVVSVLVEYAEDIDKFDTNLINKQIESAKEKVATAETKAEADSAKKSVKMLESRLKTYMFYNNNIN